MGTRLTSPQRHYPRRHPWKERLQQQLRPILDPNIWKGVAQLVQVAMTKEQLQKNHWRKPTIHFRVKTGHMLKWTTKNRGTGLLFQLPTVGSALCSSLSGQECNPISPPENGHTEALGRIDVGKTVRRKRIDIICSTFYTEEGQKQT